MNHKRSLDRSAFDSHEMARVLLAAAPGGVVRVRSDGQILDANAEACRILGLRLDEITRMLVASFEPQVVDEQHRLVPTEEYPVSIALRTGKPQGPRTLGVRRPDGSTSWAMYHAFPTFDPEGRTSGAVVSFLDISERIQIEAELRASEERWRKFVQSIPDFVVMLDADARLTAINRVLPGFDIDSVIGDHVSSYCPPEAAEILTERLGHVMATGETVHFELQARDAAGNLDWYEDTMAPLWRDGCVVGATLLARNITWRKRLEEELARSQRLASIGLLAAGVAHEINNPLTYIIGNLEHALAKAPEPELAAALEEARSGAERVKEIVRDLRLLARRDDDAIEAADLRSVARAALGIADGLLRHRARVVSDLADVPLVLGNEGRLVQVALNLLVNASQAIPAADPSRFRVRVSTRLAADGQHGELIVEDNGTGIPAEHLPRIFDPFFSTKPAGVGTGLGLAICHSIVENLGGTISVESVPGQGSRFCIRLAVDDGRAQRGAKPAAVDPSQAPRRRVLVVDDDEAVGRALALMLSAAHDVEVAHGGSEALALIAMRDFDAVLCDVMMPDIDGIALHANLLEKNCPLARRFVLMTGGVLASDVEARLHELGVPCLSKPFDRDAVLTAIGTATQRDPRA